MQPLLEMIIYLFVYLFNGW